MLLNLSSVMTGRRAETYELVTSTDSQTGVVVYNELSKTVENRRVV